MLISLTKLTYDNKAFKWSGMNFLFEYNFLRVPLIFVSNNILHFLQQKSWFAWFLQVMYCNHSKNYKNCKNWKILNLKFTFQFAKLTVLGMPFRLPLNSNKFSKTMWESTKGCISMYFIFWNSWPVSSDYWHLQFGVCMGIFPFLFCWLFGLVLV